MKERVITRTFVRCDARVIGFNHDTDSLEQIEVSICPYNDEDLFRVLATPTFTPVKLVSAETEKNTYAMSEVYFVKHGHLVIKE